VKLLKKDGAHKILDLCFGTGRHTIFLAKHGFEVYGIDISKEAKRFTEKKAKEENLGNIHLEVGDMQDLPYKNEFFDGIIAVHALPHNNLQGLKDTIKELYRVLNSGRLMFLTLLSTKDSRYW